MVAARPAHSVAECLGVAASCAFEASACRSGDDVEGARHSAAKAASRSEGFINKRQAAPFQG